MSFNMSTTITTVTLGQDTHTRTHSSQLTGDKPNWQQVVDNEWRRRHIVMPWNGMKRSKGDYMTAKKTTTTTTTKIHTLNLKWHQSMRLSVTWCGSVTANRVTAVALLKATIFSLLQPSDDKSRQEVFFVVMLSRPLVIRPKVVVVVAMVKLKFVSTLDTND